MTTLEFLNIFKNSNLNIDFEKPIKFTHNWDGKDYIFDRVEKFGRKNRIIIVESSNDVPYTVGNKGQLYYNWRSYFSSEVKISMYVDGQYFEHTGEVSEGPDFIYFNLRRLS